jgi:hypothetical protein
MPAVVTRNQLTGLKLVNGAAFRAVDIFPDLASDTIALASVPASAPCSYSDDSETVPELQKKWLVVTTEFCEAYWVARLTLSGRIFHHLN